MDKNNMVVVIIIRCVVVEVGYGDEYIKIQFLNVVMYIKNGIVIIENIWLKEI